jgi:hypothetical protein
MESLVLKRTLEESSFDFIRNGSLEEFVRAERSVCLKTNPENAEPMTLTGTT